MLKKTVQLVSRGIPYCFVKNESWPLNTLFLSSLSTCWSASWASEDEVVLKKAEFKLLAEAGMRTLPSRQMFLCGILLID